jgi:hypothetical protein
LAISEPVGAAAVVDQAARRIWSLVPTRWGALALFALSLGVYSVEALAWPVAVTFGRDSHEYLVYYLDFFHTTPLFPQVMLAHTPIAPFVLGILFEGGPRLVEAGLAVAYAASIVAYAAAAARFATLSAVLTAGALLAWPSYGSLFHQVDSDGLFALGFALWVFVVVWTAQQPSTRRFALNGLVLAALVLIRPSSQLLFLFALFPLFLGFPWRTRLRWSGAFVVAAALPLILWAGINLARYDGFTLSRDGRANIPFWRVLMINNIVRPENGPASRELVAAIRRDLVNREPYRSYDIDLSTAGGCPPGSWHPRSASPRPHVPTDAFSPTGAPSPARAFASTIQRSTSDSRRSRGLYVAGSSRRASPRHRWRTGSISSSNAATRGAGSGCWSPPRLWGSGARKAWRPLWR